MTEASQSAKLGKSFGAPLATITSVWMPRRLPNQLERGEIYRTGLRETGGPLLRVSDALSINLGSAAKYRDDSIPKKVRAGGKVDSNPDTAFNLSRACSSSLISAI
jgi:hypothetical protein